MIQDREQHTEEWRPVDGYAGLYSVSTGGVIYSHRSKRAMTQTLGKRGYLVVGLTKNRRLKHHYVHRLIGLAFLPRRAGADFINHKNGVKTDNALRNLEFCTFAENIAHKHANGLAGDTAGVKNGRARLRDDDVRLIRRLHRPDQPKKSVVELADRFGVSESAIWHLTSGRTWRHVT